MRTLLIIAGVIVVVGAITPAIKKLYTDILNAIKWRKFHYSCKGCIYYSELYSRCEDWYNDAHCMNKNHWKGVK